MTGYTVHTGSSMKFASGWDQIFKQGKSTGAKKSAAKPAKAVRKRAKKARRK